MKNQMNTYNRYTKGVKKGQPKTLTDRVIRFLIEGLNMEESPSKNKYRKFTGNVTKSSYWIGKNGAVKAGKSASDSISLTGIIYLNMRKWERITGK